MVSVRNMYAFPKPNTSFTLDKLKISIFAAEF